jgi:16S rRNA (adenine1518-N6/adenine1519-N6)-dimethyltransferase
MRPKKSLGQNFLHSTTAREAMIRAVGLGGGGLASAPCTMVLEIGPGKGFLTEALLETAVKVVAVEKDDELFDFLREKFAPAIKSGQLELIHGDILELIKGEALEPLRPHLENYQLVANIPYNLTGEIIRQFLESENQPAMMVLMLQKEVAERIVAKNGKESLLSISVKAFGEPKYIQTVRAGSFFPIPKVDSAILAIENISRHKLSSRSCLDDKKFFEIVRAGFAHKRKLLHRNLQCSTEILEKCNLNPQVRAENLNLNQWICLTKDLKNPSVSGKSSA